MTQRLFIYAALILFYAGCTKLDSQPELTDQLYADIGGSRVEAEKKVGDLDKQIEDNLKKLEDPKLDRLMRAGLSRDVRTLRERRQKFAQVVAYYGIKQKKWATHLRRQHLKAFRTKTELDLSESQSAFAINSRLRAEPRTWDHRVPKLSDRMEPINIRKPAAASAAASE